MFSSEKCKQLEEKYNKIFEKIREVDRVTVNSLMDSLTHASNIQAYNIIVEKENLITIGFTENEVQQMYDEISQLTSKLSKETRKFKFAIEDKINAKNSQVIDQMMVELRNNNCELSRDFWESQITKNINKPKPEL